MRRGSRGTLIPRLAQRKKTLRNAEEGAARGTSAHPGPSARELERDRGASLRSLVRPDSPPGGHDDRPGDREAETGPAASAIPRGLHSIEADEDPVALRRWYPRAIVG